jgi:hypothetical protein
MPADTARCPKCTHALPNRGVSLKGDGVSSEVSSRAIAQLTRAFALRIKKQVEAKALPQAARMSAALTAGLATKRHARSLRKHTHASTRKLRKTLPGF